MPTIIAETAVIAFPLAVAGSIRLNSVDANNDPRRRHVIWP
jgi:hypothetical protein